MTGEGWKPRGRPHHFVEDASTPGVCLRCPLIRRNGIHDPARVAEVEAEELEVQEKVRRQCGEREEGI